MTGTLTRMSVAASAATAATATAAPALSRQAFSRPFSQRLASAARPTRTRPTSFPLSSTPIRFYSSMKKRPRLASPPVSSALWTSRRTIFIQTESTPNADAIKFLPNHQVLPTTISAPFIEYLNPRATISPPYPSPLASQLMNVDGVTAVFYGSDFITVTKASDANWAHIRPEVFALITEAVTSGQTIVRVASEAANGSDAVDGEAAASDAHMQVEDTLQYDENDSEVVGMIKELLETRIRPAIQEDGGDIEFRGFENGQVMLKLRGACRTCDSSTVTLKNGIESMLMHYIEEVEGVTQILDPEEEIAMNEFAKFEEKLRQQKGSVPPTTHGKDSLDSVPA